MSVDERVVEAGRPARPERNRVGWGFLASRRWLGYFALLLIFSVACVLLGNWQFARRAEARAEIARIDNNYDAPAMPLGEAVPDPAGFDEDARKWQPVEVTGVYEPEPFLARGRPGPQGVGADLIQALRLADGTVFFVDRGWVPVAVSETGGLPSDLPAAPEGEVTVTARLRAGEQPVPGRTAVGRSVGSIELPELARLADAPAGSFTGAYGQLISEVSLEEQVEAQDPATGTGVLPQRPERDEGPHLSYALQWYVFIAIAAIGVGYAARQEYRALNAGDESVRREDRRRAERRRRRGPTDAEEEDAMLDG